MTAPKAMPKRTPEQIHAAQGYPSRLMLPAPKRHFFTTLLSPEECFEFAYLAKQVSPTIEPKISFRSEVDGHFYGGVFCESLDHRLFSECTKIEQKVQEPLKIQKLRSSIPYLSEVKKERNDQRFCDVCGDLKNSNEWEVIDNQIICAECAEDFTECHICGEMHNQKAHLCSDCLRHEIESNMAS